MRRPLRPQLRILVLPLRRTRWEVKGRTLDYFIKKRYNPGAMKQLIIIRHGEQDTLRHLSKKGELHVIALAEKLKPYVENQQLHICTSSASRAKDTAYALSGALGDRAGTPTLHKELWSDNEHPQDDERALSVIFKQSEDVDTLLVVTHLEYIRSIPPLFAQRILNITIPPQNLEKGDARIINCETKEAILIKP